MISYHHSSHYSLCRTAEEQRGVALVVALIVMAVLALLTISSLDMLTLNVQLAGNHERELKASYIADAGVEDAIDRLRDDSGWDAGLTDVEFPAGSGNTYTVTIDNSKSRLIIIASTGTVPNLQRSVEVQVKITGSSSPYLATIMYWKET